jgi:hypothetical protein
MEATGNVVYSSTADSFSSLQGSTIEQTSNGVATFGNFTVTYKPNSSVTLFFDMSNTVERAAYQIYFRHPLLSSLSSLSSSSLSPCLRPCVVGEIELSLFGETTICSECSPGSYSLKLNAQVDSSLPLTFIFPPFPPPSPSSPLLSSPLISPSLFSSSPLLSCLVLSCVCCRNANCVLSMPSVAVEM